MATDGGLIDRLRRPEYTGENRCVPCTATNLAIAAALAGLAWLALPGVLGPLAGATVLLASAGAIALRGYLVPGTPWLTRTYFPEWLLRAFEKEPAAGSPGAVGAPDGEAIDVEAALRSAGAVEECADVDDLCLAPGFRDAWRAAVEDAREGSGVEGDVTAVLGDGLDVEARGEARIAREDGVVVGQWASEAAFLADVAGARVLADRLHAWADLDRRGRGTLLDGLRLFLERCPACDGPVTMGEEVVQSCCRSVDVVAVSCADCGARLFETEAPGAA